MKTTEYLIVECDRYVDQRSQLVTAVIAITGRRKGIGGQKKRIEGSAQY